MKKLIIAFVLLSVLLVSGCARPRDCLIDKSLLNPVQMNMFEYCVMKAGARTPGVAGACLGFAASGVGNLELCENIKEIFDEHAPSWVSERTACVIIYAMTEINESACIEKLPEDTDAKSRMECIAEVAANSYDASLCSMDFFESPESQEEFENLCLERLNS